jgi:hypothetical protein
VTAASRRSTAAHRRSAGATTAASTGEGGATLIELIMYGALTALLLGILAVLFTTGLSSGAAATERDQATGKAQVIANSVQTSIRNSTDFRVDGLVLRARVATGTTSARCEAWALTPTGSLMHRTAATAIALPTAGYSGWTQLSTGVEGTGPGGAAFTTSGKSLTLTLAVTTGESTIPISGGTLAQATQEGTTASCW